MIEQFRVKNYKALRDVTLDLTPMHVLIGPNDTGKTSILEALGALCRSVDTPLTAAFHGSWQGRELVWRADADLAIQFGAKLPDPQGDLDYHLSVSFHADGRQVGIAEEKYTCPAEEARALGDAGPPESLVLRVTKRNEEAPRFSRQDLRRIYAALSGVHYYRWAPSFLALPAALKSDRRWQMDPTGFGLVLLLDDILGDDRDRFAKLEQRFKQIFPEIARIELVRQPAFQAAQNDAEQVPLLARADGKGIRFKLASGGQSIAAAQASDGLLLVLAYLAVLHLPKPPRVLLVEEPENGVHPGRLKEVLVILRDLVKEQSHTQVLLTTHSPYVVDLFAPEEVTLCHKGDDGAVSVRRLSTSRTVREQLDVFTLGEIWTSEGDEALAASEPAEEEPAQ